MLAVDADLKGVVRRHFSSADRNLQPRAQFGSTAALTGRRRERR
jgi:hypothetical protein